MGDVTKIAIQIELENGVTVDVTPLSPYTRAAILEKAKTVYPDPDKTPYEKEMETMTGSPIRYIDPEKERAYEKVKLDAARERLSWMQEEMIRLSVSCNGDTQAVIEAYRSDIEKLRAAGLELHEDEWDAILFHCLLAWDNDRATVMSAIMQSAELTDGEVVGAMKFFRVQV